MEERVIPFIAHESEVTCLERVIKRLWILCILIFLCLIGTNTAWIWYECQYENVAITQDVMQDSGEGGSNVYSGAVVGGDYIGEATDTNNSQSQSP